MEIITSVHQSSTLCLWKFTVFTEFPDAHNGVKVVFNSKKNNRNHTYKWKLNNTLLNDTLVKEKIRKEMKDFLEFSENEGTTYPNL